MEKEGETLLATYAVLEHLGDTVILQAGEDRIAYAMVTGGIARRRGLELGDFLLKTPVREGTSWPIEGGQAKVVAVGETVEGPAGVFHNVAVVEESRTSPVRLLRTAYAPGVGPVAIGYQVHNPATGRFEQALRATLRGYSRPGQDPLGARDAAPKER